jgi:hypothetical protein
MMLYREMRLAGVGWRWRSGHPMAAGARGGGQGTLWQPGLAVAVRAPGGSRGTPGRAWLALAFGSSFRGLAGVREDAGQFREAGAGGVACRAQDQVSHAAALEGRHPRRGGARVADHGELVDPFVRQLARERLA